MLGAVDRDAHVLPARREDLLVQHPVAGVARQGALVHILLLQRGQDADHDEAAADAAGVAVRGVEAGSHLLLQAGQGVTRQLPRRHVDLEVELPELGRPGGVRDRVEHVGVAHGRHAALVDQVQLDLQAHPRGAGLEHVFLEHLGEHFQRAPHPVAVDAPVLAADLDRLDVTTHEAPLNEMGRSGTRPVPAYTFACHGGPTPARLTRCAAGRSRRAPTSRPAPAGAR